MFKSLVISSNLLKIIMASAVSRVLQNRQLDYTKKYMLFLQESTISIKKKKESNKKRGNHFNLNVGQEKINCPNTLYISNLCKQEKISTINVGYAWKCGMKRDMTIQLLCMCPNFSYTHCKSPGKHRSHSVILYD